MPPSGFSHHHLAFFWGKIHRKHAAQTPVKLTESQLTNIVLQFSFTPVRANSICYPLLSFATLSYKCLLKASLLAKLSGVLQLSLYSLFEIISYFFLPFMATLISSLKVVEQDMQFKPCSW